MPFVSLLPFSSFTSTVLARPTEQEMAFMVVSLEAGLVPPALPTSLPSFLYLAAAINRRHYFPLSHVIQNDSPVRKVPGGARTNGILMVPRTFAKEEKHNLVCVAAAWEGE